MVSIKQALEEKDRSYNSLPPSHFPYQIWMSHAWKDSQGGVWICPCLGENYFNVPLPMPQSSYLRKKNDELTT